ncbi:40S ribosomal protein S12 [Wickerhamiella sorbophila]|uniref:40S ribosomal protein S12 n=1 Tax=Wickerhamiella sorbophila TaxID=45607 RepID=A0A2T0FL07_9ASCO|nr:40S ribosomal protein S12 [Wickerhamiella sorbophila]PRT55660.1 40S ribosomal protein S12 [Wickerhamiella sorbophila]
MSDTEIENVVEAQEVEVAAGSAAPGEISIEEAIKGVLRNALVHQGLARGLREAVKALASGEAEVCILCESITEDGYLKLVEALCNEPETKIPLIKVADAKQLGEWAGLCQLDRDGTARKVVGCSCVVVKDWGVDSAERQALLNYFQSA